MRKVNKLQKLRADKLLSQNDVSKVMNLIDQEISDLENSVVPISLEEAYLLSKIYEVSLEEIYIASKTFL